MSYLGGYLGGGGTTVPATVDTPAVTPVPSPYTPVEPQYVAYVLNALKRLPEQFRGDV